MCEDTNEVYGTNARPIDHLITKNALRYAYLNPRNHFNSISLKQL